MLLQASTPAELVVRFVQLVVFASVTCPSTINVPDDVIIDRMSGRRVHLGSGRNYHLEFNPPKVSDIDDLTGEPLIQREDDKPETVKDRLEVYRSQTLPLIDFYSERARRENLNYLKISGTGSPVDVSDLILDKIKNS